MGTTSRTRYVGRAYNSNYHKPRLASDWIGIQTNFEALRDRQVQHRHGPSAGSYHRGLMSKPAVKRELYDAGKEELARALHVLKRGSEFPKSISPAS